MHEISVKIYSTDRDATIEAILGLKNPIIELNHGQIDLYATVKTGDFNDAVKALSAIQEAKGVYYTEASWKNVNP